MLKVNETHENYRQVLREDAGSAPILALSLSMSRDDYALQVELLDRTYLEAHPDELREAMDAFLEEAGARLTAAQLPSLMPSGTVHESVNR